MRGIDEKFFYWLIDLEFTRHPDRAFPIMEKLAFARAEVLITSKNKNDKNGSKHSEK